MTTNWDADIAGRVGQAVKALREGRTPKLSAVKLAERTAQFRYPLTKAQVSDLELGRKKTITVPELISLALALGVSPVELLYPALMDGPVEVWPGVTTTSIEAVQWFSGEIPAWEVHLDERTQQSTNEKVQLSRQYAALRTVVRDANLAQIKAEFAPRQSQPAKDRAEQALRAAHDELDQLTEQLRRAGLAVSDGA
ncbi:helix-turn-helix domain-containing protein [Nocardia sp. NPDC004711]